MYGGYIRSSLALAKQLSLSSMMALMSGSMPPFAAASILDIGIEIFPKSRIVACGRHKVGCVSSLKALKIPDKFI